MQLSKDSPARSDHHRGDGEEPMSKGAMSNGPMYPTAYRVIDIKNEIPDCLTLSVEPVDELQTSQFKPGQFYMIYIFGHGEVPISVSGDPAKHGELTFTVMAVGSVTHALCTVRSGDVIGLRGPFGVPWPVDDLKGRDVIFMAGGLGLAPLRPALYHIVRNRTDYGALSLLYGTRQPELVVFSDELSEWKANAQIDVALTVDHAGRDWSGHVGVVTDLLKEYQINSAQTAALICGPEVMMRFSAYALMDQGVSAQNVFVSMERNMKCAIRMCGRCQYGPYFICKDGPVFSFDRVAEFYKVREV